jgi:hypothetical protein
MVIKTALIFMVILILMEDSVSIKKSPEAEKEDQEIAAAVNRTLAEEAREREEEKKREAKKPKKKDEEEKKKMEKGEKSKDREIEEKEGEAEASPYNCSCPEVRQCPEPVECPKPEVCPEVKRCGPCLPVEPCLPCPVVNSTMDQPPTVTCPEASAGGMSIPAAMAVGAAAALLVTGVATTIGLLLRYTSPIESGFIFLAALIFMWYLSSHHPEVARELGGRAVAVLREATAALSHRIMEAIRHREDQVGFSSSNFLRLSPMFHLKKCLH